MSSTDSILIEILAPQADYASAKVQAKTLDDQLGLRCDPIEDHLFEVNQDSLFKPGKNFWYGLEIQSLQTPYSEVVEMINHLNPQPGDIWVDLGAGYGRMGITLGFVKPEVQFVGYEFVQDRVDEGNRIFNEWHITNAVMKQADISKDEFILEPANVYFLYDFGSKEDIFKVLEKLRLQAQKQSIQVIARGRGMRSWIFTDCPWLSEVNSPVHFVNWTLFKS